jgi:thiamine pyrophosphokinase
MQAVIVANGEMHIPPHISSLLHVSTLIIAADGGVKKCKLLGIDPHIIIGDLDSLPPGELDATVLRVLSLFNIHHVRMRPTSSSHCIML